MLGSDNRQVDTGVLAPRVAGCKNREARISRRLREVVNGETWLNDADLEPEQVRSAVGRRAEAVQVALFEGESAAFVAFDQFVQ